MTKPCKNTFPFKPSCFLTSVNICTGYRKDFCSLKKETFFVIDLYP